MMPLLSQYSVAICFIKVILENHWFWLHPFIRVFNFHSQTPFILFGSSTVIRKNLEFSLRWFVRSMVAFLENRSLLFSETFQLVRTRKSVTNIPSFFGLLRVHLLTFVCTCVPIFLKIRTLEFYDFFFFENNV